jgi:hypothetical protein
VGRISKLGLTIAMGAAGAGPRQESSKDAARSVGFSKPDRRAMASHEYTSTIDPE